MRVFLENNSSGIIVSHDWTALLKLCERTMILRDKKIDFIGETYKAVQRYVNLENTVSKTDELIITNKIKLTGSPIFLKADQPLIINLDIKKGPGFNEEDFNLSFSIDRMVTGIGWSQALNGNQTLTLKNETGGSYQIIIPNPHLAPGKYLLNISLNPTVDSLKKIITKNYDLIHWLTGNQIEIEVQGASNSKATFDKKFDWKITRT
jgi:lipopolysaccharide transport system ATP-binding protein